MQIKENQHDNRKHSPNQKHGEHWRIRPPLQTYGAEATDTFGGEANYSWARRFNVRARTERGAMRMVGREMGYSFKSVVTGRYDFKDTSICAFIFDEPHEKDCGMAVKSLPE